MMLGCSSAAAGAATRPSAAVEYNLQAQVLLQNDGKARRRLHAFGPEYVPDAVIDWESVVEDVPDWLGRQAFPAPAAPIAAAFADALAARVATIRCQTHSYLPQGSPEIGMYALQCQFPDPEPLKHAYLALQAAHGVQAQAQSDALFRAWTYLLRRSRNSTHCTLVSGAQSAQWPQGHALRALQLRQAILLQLLPLDRWDAGDALELPAEVCAP